MNDLEEALSFIGPVELGRLSVLRAGGEGLTLVVLCDVSDVVLIVGDLLRAPCRCWPRCPPRILQLLSQAS